MSKMVGMSRDVNIEWLNKAVEIIKDTRDEKEVKEMLNDYLSLYITSPTNLRKTRDILMNIWLRYPDNYDHYYSKAYSVAQSRLTENSLVAHWCSIVITYQVFSDVASVIGKLYDKQIEISSSLVKEKVFDAWGERATLLHTIPKNIKTMKDIGILNQTKPGKYKVLKHKVMDQNAINLIVATILIIKGKLYMSIDDIKSCYEFFPFEYELYLEQLEASEMFSFDRFGGETVISMNTSFYSSVKA